MLLAAAAPRRRLGADPRVALGSCNKLEPGGCLHTAPAECGVDRGLPEQPGRCTACTLYCVGDGLRRQLRFRPCRPVTRLATAAPRQEVPSALEADHDTSQIPIPKLSYAPVRPGGAVHTATQPVRTAMAAGGPSQPASALSLTRGAGILGMEDQPLTNRLRRASQQQLEGLASDVLGADSGVWSATARNRPASTSASKAEDYAQYVEGKPVDEIASRIDALSQQGQVEAVVALLQACSNASSSKGLAEEVAMR